MTQTPPQVENELSEEEFELDPSAEDVEIADVTSSDNLDVPSQDPDEVEVTHAS